MRLLKGRMFEPYTYQWHPDQEDTQSNVQMLMPNVESVKAPDAICITTNGFVKNNGECVMGRGCAAQIKKMYPDFPKLVGNHIKSMGNIPFVGQPLDNGFYLSRRLKGTRIVSFPVKPVSVICKPDKSNIVKHMQSKFKAGKSVPGWAAVADINIIVESAKMLRTLANEFNWQFVVLPRPGCGAGELYWQTVGPSLHAILDDRFYAITF